MKRISLLVVLVLSLLLFVGCGSNDDHVDDSSKKTLPEEVSGPELTIPLPEGAVRTRVTEASDTHFQGDYWVPSPLEDVVDFYLSEFADWQNMYHFEGAYADGEYTFHWEGDVIDDTGIFVIEIDYYRENNNETILHIQADSYWYKQEIR